MKTYQHSIKSPAFSLDGLDFTPQLILLFISPSFEGKEQVVENISKQFPDSIISGCSTSGEISGIEVSDNSISFSAISFDNTVIKPYTAQVEGKNSAVAGKEIMDHLLEKDLRHVMIFSDGLNVNGAELVKGLTNSIIDGQKVTMTGGLAGDGADFNKTFVVHEGTLKDHIITGIGFYGDALKIGFGSQGGWDSFGIERLVTRSQDNVLFELDGQPALELYKSFLGDKADELPSSGLLFPLSMRLDETQIPVVRTILAIDEKEQSLTFAGNINQGSYVRLMKANIDRLINGAEESAVISQKEKESSPEWALLISCVGRRLVLKQMVEEEVEAVRDVLGEQTTITGFYSYGELAPFGAFSPCQLHNQTMTITTFSE